MWPLCPMIGLTLCMWIGLSWRISPLDEGKMKAEGGRMGEKSTHQSSVITHHYFTVPVSVEVQFYTQHFHTSTNRHIACFVLKVVVGTDFG